MSNKRGKISLKAPRKPARPGGTPQRGGQEWWFRVALGALAGTVAYVATSQALFWQPGPSVALIVGLAVGLLAPGAIESAVVAAVSTVLLTLAASPWFLGDEKAAQIALMVAIAGAVSGITAWVAKNRAVVVGAGAVAVLAVLLIVNALVLDTTASAGVQTLFDEISSEPAALSFTSDPFLHLKAYHQMRNGEGYYEAFETAFAAQRKGTTSRPPYSAFNYREPTIFLFWKALPGSPRAVYYALLAFMVLALGAAYAFSLALVEPGVALLSSVLLFPVCLFFSATQFGLLMEPWAMAFTLASLAVVAWHEKLPDWSPFVAAGLALVAVGIREIFVLYLLGGLLASLVLRERRSQYAWGGAFAIFAALYAVHYAISSGRIAGGAPFTLEPWLHGGAVWLKYTASYAQDVVLGAPWVPIGIVALGALAAVLATPKRLRLMIGLAIVAPVVAFTVVGLGSSNGEWPGAYWGIIYAPTALVCAPLLLRFVPGVGKQPLG